MYMSSKGMPLHRDVLVYLVPAASAGFWLAEPKRLIALNSLRMNQD